MNPAKLLLILAVVVTAIAGLWFALGSGPAEPSRPMQEPSAVEQPDRPAAPEPEAAERPAAVERTAPPTRREAVAASGGSGTELPQGVEGRLVDEYGRPVPDAEVFLFEGAGVNIFEQMLQQSQGIVKPPLARGASDAAGRFRLGVAEIRPNQVFELRAASLRHGDLSRPNLTLFDGRWWDAGDLVMPTGLVVTGRVTEQATGRPVADATVYIRGSNQMLSVTPTPGRERGIEVRTDQTGQFRIENAATGVFHVGAVAPGFAQSELANVHIKSDTDNRFDFELSPGVSIAGIVTDPAGEPIRGVRLTAHAISSKQPMTQTATTDQQGRFELMGLVEGPFQIALNAPGFAAGEEKPILAPASDEHYVLEKQGSARVRVVAANNRQVRSYKLFVKNYIPAQDTIGNLPHIPVHNVDARDLDDAGYYVVSGLDPERHYKVEVFAQGYAKAFSEPFEIVRRGDAPEVVVRLSEGGRIAGSVTGESGEPLAGVLVKTLPNDFQDNAIMQMFAPMIPYKVTQQSVRTDAQGRFELSLLMPETYQLQFSHDDHYTVSELNLPVQEGQTLEVQPVRMRRGTLVTGTATVDGQPAAQVKVTVSAKPNADGTPAASGFSATAVTDAEGRFVLPKRLPPGLYQAQAGRQGGPNIFVTVLDYKQTQTDFAVTEGMTEHRLDFVIASSQPLPGGR